MVIEALTTFPASLPEIRIEVVEEGTDLAVACDELQWWFVIPRPGEVSAARWYDRDTGRFTQAQDTTSPVARRGSDPDLVHIRMEETTWPPAGGDGTTKPIEITARLTSQAAEFVSVDIDGVLTDARDDGFTEAWGTSRGRHLRDNGRLSRCGDREYVSRRGVGTVVDLVDLTIGTMTRRAVRVLDLEPGDTPDEIGQPIIDAGTGRTLIYWQYRPETWDPDAGDWFAQHPGDDITIDGTRYQRRNCTGRDSLALTDHAVALFDLAP